MTLRTLFRSLAAAVLLAAVPAAHAVLLLTPTTAGVIGQDFGPANCEPGCVNTVFGLSGSNALVNPTDLLYKGNLGGADEGSFAASYSTVFSNSAGDPEDALISYISGPSIACPGCYLAIKDGNQDPSYYFYNLAAWNGTEAIQLDGFWPQQGAISHVSIWGKVVNQVPEPGSLALLSAALAGLGAFVRGRAKNSAAARSA
jgi:hypothetical protein